MKKTIIVFVVSAIVLFATGLWFFSSKNDFKTIDFLQFGVIVLVVGFAAFAGYKRLTSSRRGEPAEDELSKKVMQKTAALSYYISIYLWLVLAYFSDRINLETHTIFGLGIVGMALVFALCWAVFNYRGIRNE